MAFEDKNICSECQDEEEEKADREGWWLVNKAQLPLIEISTNQIPVLPAPQQNIYLVAAFNLQRGYWKIHRDSHLEEYRSFEQASDAANTLGNAWGNLTILHIRLGEKAEGA